MTVKAYCKRALKEFHITRPEIVIPETAHSAFVIAGKYFGVKIGKTRVDKNFRAIPSEIRKVVHRDTVAIVGSAPSFAQ
jgi:sphinganine-1-phosphate aldolase